MALRFTGRTTFDAINSCLVVEAFEGTERVLCAVSQAALDDHAGVGTAPQSAYAQLQGRIHKKLQELYDAGAPKVEGRYLVRSGDL